MYKLLQENLQTTMRRSRLFRLVFMSIESLFIMMLWFADKKPQRMFLVVPICVIFCIYCSQSELLIHICNFNFIFLSHHDYCKNQSIAQNWDDCKNITNNHPSKCCKSLFWRPKFQNRPRCPKKGLPLVDNWRGTSKKTQSDIW